MHTRRPRVAAALAAAIVLPTTAVSVLVSATPASAAVTGSVEDGTATWGISTYLNSANFGRPNPLPEAYAAPATFDATSRLSTWGAGSGAVALDGSADLAFEGRTVNFAKTSGAWLTISDVEVDLDADGNGTVSAAVAYGMGGTGTAPNLTYDPSDAPDRATERVEIVDLAGNTAADRAVAAGTATWTGLDGTWAPELQAFLAGDATADPAVPGFVYAGQVNANADRTPSPFTFSVETTTPTVTAEVTGTSASEGVAVAVTGDGFRGVSRPGDNGVYVGLAPSGGLPDVSSPTGMSAFAAADYRPAVAIPTGAFTSTLVAAADDLDPTTTYSVYTWQAHGHSNTSQDTETPVEIDFDALKRPTTTTATGPTSRPYGRTSTITAAVDGPGTVTLAGVGAEQSGEVVDGTAVFTVPAGLAAGRYTATLTYAGGPSHLASSTTRVLTVTKAATRTRLTVVRKPTPGSKGRAGSARVVVGGPADVAAPTGTVTVTLTRAGGRKRVVTGTLRGGAATVTLPKVARGTWTAVASYAGNGSFATSKQTKRFTVR